MKEKIHPQYVKSVLMRLRGELRRNPKRRSPWRSVPSAILFLPANRN